jgi:hypothetical protein
LNERSGYATQRLVPEQSPFLKAFGQPKRESPCACERVDEPTVDQLLQLLNGPLVAGRVKSSAKAYADLGESELVEKLWLAAFSRLPAAEEKAKALEHFKKAANRNEAICDLVWAIVNTREFLLQH